MKNKIIILMLVLFLIPSVMGGLQDDMFNDALLINNFDESLIQDNSTFQNTASIVSTLSQDNSTFKVGTGSFLSSTVGAYINHANILAYTAGVKNYSISLWIRPSGDDFNPLVNRMNNDGIGEFQFIYDGVNDEVETCFVKAGGGDCFNNIASTTAVNTNQWNMITLVFNQTGAGLFSYLYLNNTLLQEATFGSGDIVQDTHDVLIGTREFSTATSFLGNLDAVYWINHSLSDAEIAVLYTLGEAGTPLQLESTPPPVDNIINDTKPVININSPTNGDILDNFTYPLAVIGNVTVQNGTISTTTINNTNFNNGGSVTQFNFTINGTAIEEVYNLNVTSVSQHGNQTSSLISFTVDFTNPDILNSNFDTPLFHYTHGVNLSILVNASDNHLIYSMNISTNGYVMNVSGLNVVSYIYNQSINTSAFPLGENNIEVGVCDAHTSNKIPSWSNSKNNVDKSLNYNFNNGYVKIRPEVTTGFINFETYKSKDRYHFVYEQTTPGTRSFFVESSEFIDIIGNKKGFNGWLVIPALNKWVDFNLPGIDSSNYIIKRIDDNKVKVTIVNSPKLMDFESIGELNCNFQTYSYYLYNYSVEYESAPLETSEQTYKYILDYPEPYNIEIDLIYNGTRYNTVNASKNYSYTLIIPEITPTIQPINFYFNFSINDSYNETPEYLTTYNSIVLDTCTELNNDTKTINISLYDEQSPTTLIDGNVEGTFVLYANSPGNFINTTISLSGSSQYSLCLYPNATVTTDATLYYNTTGGFTQRWFLEGATISNVTTLLDLFNFASQTGISDVRGVLRDTSYNFFSNVIAKLLKFYPGENIYRTVQMDKADDFGQILFHVIEESTDYIVTFSKNGAEIDRTNPLKFICDSAICSVTFVVEETAIVTDSDIAFTYGYDNISQMFQLNWTESTGLTDTVRLRVSKFNNNVLVDVCDNTITSNAGTINCNTTGYVGVLSARVYTTQSPETEVLLVLIEKLVDKFYQLQGLDDREVGMWAVGITIILSTAGLMVSIVLGVMLYLVALLVIYYLGLLSFLTLSYIVIALVLGIIVMILVRK